MKLISMIRFVKEQGNIGMEIQSIRYQQSDRARRSYLIQKYADFLLKDITIGMVVPCDEFGNLLEEPDHLDFKYKNKFNELVFKSEFQKNKYADEYSEYQQAKNRVLFRGFKSEFKVVDVRNGISYVKSISDDTELVHLFWFDKITQTWGLSSGLFNIESLTKFSGIELTETALKEIGLLNNQ